MANSKHTDHTIHQEQSHLGLLFAQALYGVSMVLLKWQIFCKHRGELLKEQSDPCLYSLPPQGKPFTHLSCPPYLAGEE